MTDLAEATRAKAADKSARSAERRDIAGEIAAVERRLAIHRERLKRDADAARLEARRRATPLPVVGLAALAILGFAIARMTRREPERAFVHAYRRVDAPWREPEVEVVRPRRAGALARLAAVAGMLLRFGTSPQARMLWHAVQRRRTQRGA